jgi:hypothetical protein
LTIAFISSCSSDLASEKKVQGLNSNNPLDSIVGEKLVDESSGAIRKDNFSDFLDISKQNLIQKTKLFDVSKISSHFYSINQSKTYKTARSFSVILKIKNDSICKYYVKNDFQIIDHIKHSKGLTSLFGNFGNYSRHWKTNNEIELIRFDNNLNQLWVYAPSSNKFPLEAIEVEDRGDFVRAEIDVVTGCHECTNTFELRIDSLGNCFSAVEIDKTNSSITLSTNTIDEIFKIHITANKRH